MSEKTVVDVGTPKDAVTPTSRNVDPASLVFVRRRHPLRWLFASAVIVIVAGFVVALATNDNVDYATIGQYLFDPEILAGLLKTLVLTVLLMALAIVLGMILAVMRLSHDPVAKATAWTYIWFMRGVPVLVQMIFWFNIGLVISVIHIGIPGTDLQLAALDTNTLMTPFMAALFGLGLAEAAYMAEIIRGGLMGVDKGQSEAAAAIGMTGFQSFRHIVMPQAWRIVVPPVGNEFITMFKVTSLASVVGVTELLGAARMISATNYRVFELLLVATFWYLVCTTVLSVVQFLLERRLGRSYRSTGSPRESVA